MITVEFFNPEKHYETISKWWLAQNWPVLTLDVLSTTGIVVNYNARPAAAAWIYKTNSSICILEWIVADPEIRGEIRSMTLSTLISVSKLTANMMGFKSIFMSIKNESLGKRIEEQGFQSNDKGMTNYVCHLHGGI